MAFSKRRSAKIGVQNNASSRALQLLTAECEPLRSPQCTVGVGDRSIGCISQSECSDGRRGADSAHHCPERKGFAFAQDFHRIAPFWLLKLLEFLGRLSFCTCARAITQQQGSTLIADAFIKLQSETAKLFSHISLA